MAERLQMPPIKALQTLLMEFETAVREGQMKLPGLFTGALERLQRDMEAQRIAEIDSTKLHHNPKVRSGFEGVYMNGTKFAAFVPDPNGGGAIMLDRYATPIEAAWARREYFHANGLSYGGLAEETQRIMKEMEGTPTTPEFARRLAINENAKRGVLFPDLSDEDRKWERMSPFDAEYDPRIAAEKAEKKRKLDEENRVRTDAYRIKRVAWREEQAKLAAIRNAEAAAEKQRVIDLRASEKAALERIRVREGRGPMLVPTSTNADDD